MGTSRKWWHIANGDIQEMVTYSQWWHPGNGDIYRLVTSIVMSPRRHHFSWGHHFRCDYPLNRSQLNCHKSSGTGKFCYSSASSPLRHHFSWGHPFTGATPVLSVNWTVIRGVALANLAIPVPLLFWRLLQVPHLLPCSSIDWTQVFCIVKTSLL